MAYRYIDHTELAQLIRSGAQAGRDYQVVDVRDHDFVGGNITGALHQPSEQSTEQTVQDLVTKLESVPKVIFHCALSQVRGPKAARIYAEARSATSVPPPPPSSRSKATAAAPPTKDEVATAFSLNPYEATPTPAAEKKEGGAEGRGKEQEVLVLRDGFEGWQGLYRKDPLLVERFDEALWGSYAA